MLCAATLPLGGRPALFVWLIVCHAAELEKALGSLHRPQLMHTVCAEEGMHAGEHTLTAWLGVDRRHGTGLMLGKLEAS